METTVNERVRILRKSLKMSQHDFSELVGIAQTSVSRIEKGTNAPHKSTLLQIANATNSNVDWLLTGKGEMTFEGEEKTETTVSENSPSKTTQWKEEAYKRLEEAYESSKAEIQFLRGLVNKLAANGNFNESFALVGFQDHLKFVETVSTAA